jgi:hypothetical protein
MLLWCWLNVEDLSLVFEYSILGFGLKRSAVWSLHCVTREVSGKPPSATQLYLQVSPLHGQIVLVSVELGWARALKSGTDAWVLFSTWKRRHTAHSVRSEMSSADTCCSITS